MASLDEERLWGLKGLSFLRGQDGELETQRPTPRRPLRGVGVCVCVMAELIQKKLQGAVEKHQQLWEGLEQTQVREAEAGGTANRRSSIVS